MPRGCPNAERPWAAPRRGGTRPPARARFMAHATARQKEPEGTSACERAYPPTCWHARAERGGGEASRPTLRGTVVPG
eukprot:2516415-Lingulodinium_polyedra.AAC.1